MSIREIKQSPEVKPKLFYGYVVAAAALFIMVIIYSTRFSYGVFFKPMLTEFGWTRALTSGALSISMFIQGFLAIIMGGLSDRLGPRIVLTVCGLLVGLGFLLMSRIDAAWQLYLFYGLIIAPGMSGVWIPLLSTIVRWFVAKRSLMTGVVGVGTGTGVLVGPPVANWLISNYGWRVAYMISGIAVWVVVILAAQLLKRDPTKIKQMPYGANKEDIQQINQGTNGLSFEKTIRTRQFWIVCALFFCCGFCIFAIMVHIVPHATDLGIPDASAAGFLAAIGGVSIAGNIILGSIGDILGNRRAFLIGFILISAALFWLVQTEDVWMLYLFSIVFGLAYGGIAPLQSPLISELFGLHSHGLIFGVAGFCFTIGAAVGPWLVGYLFDINGSYQLAFLVCAFIGIVGLTLSALIKPIKDKNLHG